MSRTLLLRLDALMVCTHELGRVGLAASQKWVRCQGTPLLVDDDPEKRPIAGCPNLTVTTKPCTQTLRVRSGYSKFVRIDAKAVCLNSLIGTTDGPGGVFSYKVNDPGQQLVAEVTP